MLAPQDVPASSELKQPDSLPDGTTAAASPTTATPLDLAVSNPLHTFTQEQKPIPPLDHGFVGEPLNTSRHAPADTHAPY